MKIVKIESHKKRFLPLLLTADEDERMIDKYIERGEMFALYDDDLKTVCVVTDESGGNFEIKNIATAETQQHKGYGKRLIAHVCEYYSGKCKAMLVGTGAGTETVEFYKKCGFTPSHIIENFFTDNYPAPMFDNGKQLVDMVYLTKHIISTERLYLRELTEHDHAALAAILQDIDVMYAWEHAFSDEEISAWIAENILRYRRDGYSYMAAIEKTSGELIGVCGLLEETADNENYTGVGYIFAKKYWKKGFAYEVAYACVQYGFEILGKDEITAQIRPENTASVRLAEKLGMAPLKTFTKHYNNKYMPHILFGIKKPKQIRGRL